MKWMFLGAIAIICCGGPLLLILLGANAGLIILGLLLNNWLVFLLGLVALIGGVGYYVWRRYRQRKRDSWR